MDKGIVISTKKFDKKPKVKKSRKDFAYGYRITRKPMFGNEHYIDYHQGAYGFWDYDSAIKDAKDRIESDSLNEAFTWFVDCYSYNTETMIENSSNRVVLAFNGASSDKRYREKDKGDV